MDGLKFPKKEHLCSEQILSEVFTTGKSLVKYPLRLSYVRKRGKNENPVLVAFIVSKRLYGKAVDRNQIKRRMREAYRLNRKCFVNNCIARGYTYQMAISFTAKEKAGYSVIEAAMKELLAKLEKTLL